MFQLVLCHMKMHFQLINKMVHSAVHRYINHVPSTNSASRHLFDQFVPCLLIQKKHVNTTYTTTKLLENITVLKYCWLENIVWFYAPDIVWFCCTQSFQKTLQLLLQYHTKIRVNTKKKDKGVAKTFRFTLKLEPIEVNFVDFVDSSHGGKRLETNEHFEAFNKT